MCAGGDNVHAVAAIVGEGRAKVVSTVPVRVTREPMDWETYVAKAASLRLKMDGWSSGVDGGG